MAERIRTQTADRIRELMSTPTFAVVSAQLEVHGRLAATVAAPASTPNATYSGKEKENVAAEMRSSIPDAPDHDATDLQAKATAEDGSEEDEAPPLKVLRNMRSIAVWDIIAIRGPVTVGKAEEGAAGVLGTRGDPMNLAAQLDEGGRCARFPPESRWSVFWVGAAPRHSRVMEDRGDLEARIEGFGRGRGGPAPT